MKAGTTIRTTGVGLILHACHHSDEMEAVGRVFGRMKEWMQEFF